MEEQVKQVSDETGEQVTMTVDRLERFLKSPEWLYIKLCLNNRLAVARERMDLESDPLDVRFMQGTIFEIKQLVRMPSQDFHTLKIENTPLEEGIGLI